MDDSSKEIVHPKEGEWVLITDNIKEAFDHGYQGVWSAKHHALIGQLLKVSSIDTPQFPSAIITCRLPDQIRVKTFIDFPSNCIKRLDKNIPEGWLPATLIPKLGKLNIFIGLTEHNIPILVSWVDDTWIQYYSRKTMIVKANIIAYQTILNFPIKRKPK